MKIEEDDRTNWCNFNPVKDGHISTPRSISCISINDDNFRIFHCKYLRNINGRLYTDNTINIVGVVQKLTTRTRHWLTYCF